MASNIFDLIKERTVLLDGGMGTELIKHGIPQGTCSESWNEEKPEIVKIIHKSYFDAGSDVVLTNSFGGNKVKLDSHGLGERCHELNLASAKLAVEVRPEGKFVAGSMGPTGKFLQPHGEFTEEAFETAYGIQAKALTEGGVDFLLIETQYDLKEALCALRGVKKSSDLPVFVTMTFNLNPKGYFTIMGNSVSQCIEDLEKNDVPVLGTNCTLDSSDMVNLIKVMREATPLPLIAQANAGQPAISSDGNVVYSQEIEDYVSHIPQMVQNGANIIGGCCGTNPEYIRRMAEVIKEKRA
jgi:5-methyltetrahydrofolate--homocysteine methyltransferase